MLSAVLAAAVALAAPPAVVTQGLSSPRRSPFVVELFSAGLARSRVRVQTTHRRELSSRRRGCRLHDRIFTRTRTSTREGAGHFRELTQDLAKAGARVSEAWGLLGPHDYLLLLDIDGTLDDAFAAVSVIAQSGSMRTQSFVAMPLSSYFELAATIASPGHDASATETAAPTR